MTSDEIEFLAQLSEATVLTLRGDLRGAEECLSQGEPAEHAALNELKAATTLLIRRLSETLAAKESALASVQLSMLELESARDELQAKEARYRELVSNMNEGVVVCEAVDQGADFVIREINRAALRTESMESSNPRGQRLTSVLPGAKDCGLLDALRRVHATGAAEQMSRHAYQVGHQCGWREGFVYQLPTGEVVAVYRDVTAQRASEEALRASNERFQSLTRTALDAIIILDPAGCIETWNPAAEMIFGYAARDAVGKDARQLLVLKDDWALHRAADCGKEETGLETAVSKTLEQEVRRRDGTLIPVELTLSMFRNEDGWRVAAIVRDVSARRQAESGLRQERILLRTVVDHLPDGV